MYPNTDIYVASYLLENREMAVMAVVYSSFAFLSTLFYDYLAKRFGSLFHSDEKNQAVLGILIKMP